MYKEKKCLFGYLSVFVCIGGSVYASLDLPLGISPYKSGLIVKSNIYIYIYAFFVQGR